jgi:hypothetical protein
VAFIIYIPNMLNAGNNIGAIKNALSSVVKFKFGRIKNGSLNVLYFIIISAINTTFNAVKRYFVDNGVLYPILNDKLFINSPKNITNEMLNPTDNTNFSVRHILLILSI